MTGGTGKIILMLEMGIKDKLTRNYQVLLMLYSKQSM